MFKHLPGNVSEFIHNAASKRLIDRRIPYHIGAIAALVEFLDCHQAAERSVGKALKMDETLEWIQRRNELNAEQEKTKAKNRKR